MYLILIAHLLTRAQLDCAFKICF